MSETTVSAITKILLHHVNLLVNVQEFSDILIVPSSSFIPWERNYNNGNYTPYKLLSEIIANWTDRNGKLATTDALCKILEGIKQVSAKDELKENYPNSVRIVRELAQLVVGPISNGLQTTSGTPSTDLRIVRLLGAGSFGLVFEVERNGLQFASKLIVASSNSTDDLKELQEFQREIQIMKDKSHPNIVKQLDHHKFDKATSPVTKYVEAIGLQTLSDNAHRLYNEFLRLLEKNHLTLQIDMELCGPTLRHWLSDSSQLDQENELRLQIGQGLIEGIKYLHGQDHPILHRDLNPGNIYFSPKTLDNQYILPIKIGDFGCCREVEGDYSQYNTKYAGTKEYRAKEVDLGQRYGPQADLYSLGLILFEMFQRIPYSDRRAMFTKLVDFRNRPDVVEDNLRFPNLKGSIIGLTKMVKEERTKCIGDLNIF